TFTSFKIRNFRLYFFGRGVSLIGSWMHVVGMGWLVLLMTGSGTALGGVMAAKFFPMFFAAPIGGLIADRFDKRRVLYWTQSILAVLALGISYMVFTETITLTSIYVFALATGFIDSIDQPTRQAFVHEMVGPEYLRNAITLNSTLANLTRVIGPLTAGLLIAGAGIAFCFFVNALSFLAVLVMLFLINPRELRAEKREKKTSTDLLAGIRYASTIPLLRTILITMAIVGIFSYEFQTSLPLLARTTFLGGASDYAALLAAMGAGSVAGGLFAASRKSIVAREFVIYTLLFGISICVAALMPSIGTAIVMMIFVGFFSINMSSLGNTMVQLSSSASMRGQVMSLWTMAIFGTTLIGAPLIGWIGEHIDPRAGLALGGIAALLAGAYAGIRLLPKDTLLSIPSFIWTRGEEIMVDDTKV
ncbi:MAG: MFS transporter, partial [Patescibacteria group bacterium]